MAATPPPAIDSDDDASFGLKFTLGMMEGVTNPNPSPPGKILKSQCATHVCIHIYIHVYILLKFTVGMIEGCLLISLKYPSVAVCCSVLQCVAVCCSVLQSLVNIPQQSRLLISLNHSSFAVCCSVLQCVAVCCSVLQCVAV